MKISAFLFFFIPILTLFFQKSKLIRYLSITFLFILMCLNYQNPDYNSYLMIYNDPVNAQEEIGYRFLCMIGKLFGLEYQMFFSIIMFISTVLLLNSLRKIVKHHTSNLIIGLLIIYPMIMNVILQRTYIASCICVYAISFLLEDKKNKFKFIFFILIASSIHISSLIFLILLFINDNLKKTIRITLPTTLLIVCLLKYDILQNAISSLFSYNHKVSLMLSNFHLSFSYILLYGGLYFINFLVFYLFYCINKKMKRNKNISEKILSMHACLVILIVFMLFSDQFVRVFRVFMIINLLYCTQTILSFRLEKRIMLGSLLVLFSIVLLCYRMGNYYMFGEIYWKYVFEAILKNNYFLNILY